jgi:small conductance mechanosensitive channel
MDINITKPLAQVVDKLEGWVSALLLMLPNIVVALLLMVVFFLTAKLLRRIAERTIGRLIQSDALKRLAVNLVGTAVIGVGLFVALSVLQLHKAVLSLLAGVGVIGLALGFAFQDIAANFMAGVLMLLRRPLRVGEIIKTNDYYGRVQRMDLRNIHLRTWSGQLVLIPNKEVYQKPLINYSRHDERRAELAVGVSYGEDLDHVEQLTREAVEQIDGRDTSREVEVYFTGFGGSSIDLVVRWWLEGTEESEAFVTRDAALKAIKRTYDAQDISIPFPIRTLDFGIKGGQPLSAVLGEGVQRAPRGNGESRVTPDPHTSPS